ncbi:hypothetical protein COP2_023809 [Malus domestica]
MTEKLRPCSIPGGLREENNDGSVQRTPNISVNSSLRSFEYPSRFTNLIFGISDDTLNVTCRRNVHEKFGGDDDKLIADGEVNNPRQRVKIERSTA